MKICNVFVKLFFQIILPLTIQTVNAQYDWELTIPMDHPRVQARDMIEIGSHSLILIGITQSSVTRTWVYQIGNGTEIISTQQLVHQNQSIYAQEFITDLSTEEYHVISSSFDSLFLNGYGIIHFRSGADFSFELVGHFPLFGDSVAFSSMSGSILNNEIIVPLSGKEPPTTIVPNRLILVRSSTTGILQDHAKYGTGNGILLPRRSVLLGSDTIVTSITGGGNIPAPGLSNFIFLNEDLDLIGGFPATNVFNDGPATSGNVLFNGMYIHMLDPTTLVCSGEYGTGDTGYRAAIVRYSLNGDHEAQFTPVSGFFHDGWAIIQGHDILPGGGLVHAYVENFHPYPPNVQMGDNPSRIRIHRLDTMLNPLCDFVIDGFEDSTYYFLNRIKATSDGGVVVMGSKRDLNTMGLPQAWVRKIAPNDCLTSIPEIRSGQQEVLVFPNPGTAGFNLHLQGPVVHRGKVHLHDMHGREVLVEPLNMSQAYIPAEELASGIYLYRVVDAHGRAVASGKWVKE